MEAESLTFWRGSEVSQVLLRKSAPNRIGVGSGFAGVGFRLPGFLLLGLARLGFSGLTVHGLGFRMGIRDLRVYPEIPIPLH